MSTTMTKDSIINTVKKNKIEKNGKEMEPVTQHENTTGELRVKRLK